MLPPTGQSLQGILPPVDYVTPAQCYDVVAAAVMERLRAPRSAKREGHLKCRNNETMDTSANSSKRYNGNQAGHKKVCESTRSNQQRKAALALLDWAILYRPCGRLNRKVRCKILQKESGQELHWCNGVPQSAVQQEERTPATGAGSEKRRSARCPKKSLVKGWASCTGLQGDGRRRAPASLGGLLSALEGNCRLLGS